MDAKPILAAIIPAAIIVAIFLPIENILGTNNAVNPNQSPSEYCIVESASSPKGDPQSYQLCILKLELVNEASSNYCIKESASTPKGNPHTNEVCIANAQADPDNPSKGNPHDRI
jgi:hypothetical protein